MMVITKKLNNIIIGNIIKVGQNVIEQAKRGFTNSLNTDILEKTELAQEFETKFETFCK